MQIIILIPLNFVFKNSRYYNISLKPHSPAQLCKCVHHITWSVWSCKMWGEKSWPPKTPFNISTPISILIFRKGKWKYYKFKEKIILFVSFISLHLQYSFKVKIRVSISMYNFFIPTDLMAKKYIFSIYEVKC